MTIFEAIQAGDPERVRELVAADPALATARDENGLSALMRARYDWRLDIVDALLSADPGLDVFEAAALGRVDGLDAAAPGAWSPDGFTPLHLAAFFGQVEAAQRLLELGADATATARNPLAVQPIHSAAATGQREIVESLLAAGADANVRQTGGFTPLHAAAQNGDAELARILLDAGADPLGESDEGKDARGYAAERGHDAVVEALDARR